MNLEINDQEIEVIRKSMELYLSSKEVDVPEHIIFKNIFNKLADLQS
jgi:hypothetical protein